MVAVVPFKRPINTDAIRIAESLVERAKAGEIDALVYCATCPDGSVDTGQSTAPDMFRILAAVDRLRHRIHMLMDTNINDIEAK